MNELTLIGSRCGPFAPAIEALCRHDLQLENLIFHRFKFTHMDQAFSQAAKPQTMKVVITPEVDCT